MRAMAVAACSMLTLTAALGDPMATRFGNTTLALDPDGTVTRLTFAPGGNFQAQRGRQNLHGIWKLDNGQLCIEYRLPPHGPRETDCNPAESHAVGDVWLEGKRHVTLVAGLVAADAPEAKAALAAAARVGNTIVAKDPDGTETRLYWRPDHTFSATRPGWKTEGTWKVSGSSLFLHYNVPRPNMGSDEEMKNATPRNVGEVWGMADRSVTLVAGEQLHP
jgi:hypothetical protein